MLTSSKIKSSISSWNFIQIAWNFTEAQNRLESLKQNCFNYENWWRHQVFLTKWIFLILDDVIIFLKKFLFECERFYLVTSFCKIWYNLDKNSTRYRDFNKKDVISMENPTKIRQIKKCVTRTHSTQNFEKKTTAMLFSYVCPYKKCWANPNLKLKCYHF